MGHTIHNTSGVIYTPPRYCMESSCDTVRTLEWLFCAVLYLVCGVVHCSYFYFEMNITNIVNFGYKFSSRDSSSSDYTKSEVCIFGSVSSMTAQSTKLSWFSRSGTPSANSLICKYSEQVLQNRRSGPCTVIAVVSDRKYKYRRHFIRDIS